MKNNKIGVIITSVIKCSEKPLSYSDTRSIFTKEERLEQTIKTIESIRNFIPNSEIILIELGKEYSENNKIKKIVDQYIDFSKDKMVRFFVDSRYKGLGEVFGILKGINYIKNNYDFYIKISGRYILTKNIPENFYNDSLGFLKINVNYSTRFYIISKNYFKKYKTILKISLFLTILRSVERIFYIIIPKKWVYNIENIGLEGQIGVDKNTISE
jgi:hypothetical protein